MEQKENDELLIEIKNADFLHEPGSDLNKLYVSNLKIYSGELIAVIGSVGSGKSTLMESLLNETHFGGNGTFKFHKNNTKFAWINQSYFVMNGTIRENIIMSNSFDIDDYNKVIESCSLVHDLKLFAAGDKTEIGEKGINLSGGQRARICIARALYEQQHSHDVDIILFDDSLSAVDNDVAKHIFSHSILGICSNITRIVIMNSHLQFLKYFDRVLVMKYSDEEGCCKLVENTTDLTVLQQKFSGLLQNSQLQNEEREREKQLQQKETEFQKEIEEVKLEALKEDIIRKTSMFEDEGESIMSFNVEDLNLKKQKLLTKDEFEKMSKLISKEDRVRGAIASNSLITYLNNASNVIQNGVVLFIILFIFYMLTQSIAVSFDIWLSWWGAAQDSDAVDTRWTPFFDTSSLTSQYWMSASWIFVGCIILVGFTRTMLLFKIALTASNHFEQGILDTVLHATIAYFDSTPIGRITNRFSRDLSIIDSEMPVTMELISLRLVLFISYIIVLSIFIPYYLLLMLPSVFVIIKLRNFYIATTREIKRLDGISRSPMYNIFNECIFGLQTIRVFKYQKYFINKFEKQIVTNSRPFFDFAVINRFFAIILESIIMLQALFIAICVVFLKDQMAPNIAALCITYATTFAGQFQYMIRLTAEFENQLTAVERLHAFTQIGQEPPHFKEKEDNKCKELSWPSEGRIQFKNLRFKYRQDLPFVLKGISCEIPFGSKVGICGRTGAGKSSIMVCLFRLFEFEHSNENENDGIFIDNVNISDIGLFMLRNNICIIPQEPVLLSGTLRFNLDPFNKYTDSEIIHSLKQSFLWDFIKEKEERINYMIAENGLNLSKGQRQLVCISRALLKKPKILLLDEATSNIDYENDQLIQASIKNNFKNCTILTIAHRLDTIMDSNKIIVLENGTIAQFDTPQNLLRDTEGSFYNLYHSVSNDKT